MFDDDFTDVLSAGGLRRTPLCTDQFFVAISGQDPLVDEPLLRVEELSDR